MSTPESLADPKFLEAQELLYAVLADPSSPTAHASFEKFQIINNEFQKSISYYTKSSSVKNYKELEAKIYRR